MDMVARPDLLKQFAGAAVGAISVLSDEAAIKAAFKLVHKTTDLVWIVLEEFKRAQDQLSTEVDHSSAARAARFVVMADAAQRLNDRLVRLFHECPDNTVFMVVSGDPSTTEYKAYVTSLRAMCRAFQRVPVRACSRAFRCADRFCAIAALLVQIAAAAAENPL